MTFETLGLDDLLLKAVRDVGYEIPTPIQAQVIPHVLSGKDVIGCAQTGTGKTASFILPMIHMLASGRTRARMPRSLVLEPTRELAEQVAKDFEGYGKHHKLRTAVLIGGSSMVQQEKLLDRGVDVLIATPGRLLDLFGRGKILLADIRIFVLDEADRMLDMGFIPDIQKIMRLLPASRQTLLFSATMPNPIRKLSQEFLSSPEEVTLTTKDKTAKIIKQYQVAVTSRTRSKILCDILQEKKPESAIVFCNRKSEIKTLCAALQKVGMPAAALHGDMHQSLRSETLESFKKGEISLLIASDVAARGLDVEKLSAVFNYNVPTNADDFVHRVGRTGRAGQSGMAFTFVSPDEEEQWQSILKKTKATVEPYFEKKKTDKAPEVPTPQAPKAQAPKHGTSKPGAAKSQAQKPKQQQTAQEKTLQQARPSPRPSQTHPSEARPSEPVAPQEPVVGFGDSIPAFMQKPRG